MLQMRNIVAIHLGLGIIKDLGNQKRNMTFSNVVEFERLKKILH